MKILLIYPPNRGIPFSPYSSLPYLTSCLKQAGHEVILRDINLEVFNSIAKETTLLHYFKCRSRLLRKLESQKSLNHQNTEEYRALSQILSVPKSFLENVSSAIRILKSKEDFYKPNLFNQAIDNLRGVVDFFYGEDPFPFSEVPNVVDKLFKTLNKSTIDPISDVYKQGLIASILCEKPDLIGVSIPFMTSYYEAMKLIKNLRTQAPDISIVIGGRLLNSNKNLLVNDPRLYQLIDFAMTGECDTSFCKLASSLENGGKLEEVPNLYYKLPDGTVKNTEKQLVEDLNSLPTPDFTGLPLGKYMTPEPVISFQTSRGCYHGKCVFCSSSFRDNFRFRDPRLVMEDMINIKKSTGVKYYNFWDSLTPPKTLRYIAREVKARGLTFHWFAETKFEKVFLKDQFMQTLKEGGCRLLHFGLESANQRILDLVNKNNDIEDVDKILDNAYKAGIKTSVSWFIGFPTETKDEASQTYDFLKDRRHKIALSIYSGVYDLLPDQKVYNDSEKYGIKINQNASGKYEYTYKDNLKPYDRTEYDKAFRARGDWDILLYDVCLLYAVNNSDGLKKITNYYRMGPLIQHNENLHDSLIQRTKAAHITSFGRDPIKDFNLPPSPVKLVYSSITREVFRLRGKEMMVLEATSELTPVFKLKKQFNMDWSELKSILSTLINRGIIRFVPDEKSDNNRDAQVESILKTTYQ